MVLSVDSSATLFRKFDSRGLVGVAHRMVGHWLTYFSPDILGSFTKKPDKDAIANSAAAPIADSQTPAHTDHDASHAFRVHG